jgi:hypothetical protein
MVDPTPDPIDQTYRDAEALLTEQAERSARRARVLAAVAQDKGLDPVERPTLAPRFASRYGWLVAASVMIVSGYLVLRFLPSQQPGSPPIAQIAAIKPPQKNQMTAALSPPAPVPDLSVPAPAGPTSDASDRVPLVTHERTASSSKRAVSAAPPPPAPQIAPSPPIATAPAPPAIAAAPPPAMMAAPPPPPMAARLAAPPAAAPALRTDAAKPMGELGTKPGFDELRAAARAGRIAEVQELLDRHILVDSTDADGETALMKSVRADQPATAALLIRHGASLDKKNNAGFSARDIATQVNDPALKRALGLQP